MKTQLHISLEGGAYMEQTQLPRVPVLAKDLIDRFGVWPLARAQAGVQRGELGKFDSGARLMTAVNGENREHWVEGTSEQLEATFIGEKVSSMIIFK